MFLRDNASVLNVFSVLFRSCFALQNRALSVKKRERERKKRKSPPALYRTCRAEWNCEPGFRISFLLLLGLRGTTKKKVEGERERVWWQKQNRKSEKELAKQNREEEEGKGIFQTFSWAEPHTVHICNFFAKYRYVPTTRIYRVLEKSYCIAHIWCCSM